MGQQPRDDHPDEKQKVDPPEPTGADYPPPEEDLGGGDICSLEETPSTDDDRPLP